MLIIKPASGNGVMMSDTLKTTAGGLGSAAVIRLGILPDIVSIGVGIITMIYFGIKIYKEIQ